MMPAGCSAVNPWLTHRVRIQRITAETTGVATYDLAFDDPSVGSAFSFRPGQFNMLYLPGLGEIAISISGDPHVAAPAASTSGELAAVAHTVREAGLVTTALARLKVGDSLGLRGPFGRSWPIDVCEGRDVILVAGGIGLAPLRPVIYEIICRRSAFGNVTLLCGARSPNGLLFTEEYDSWQAAGIAVGRTVDRASAGWKGNVGVVTQLLERMPLQSPATTVLLTCGPEVMMWYTIQSALQRGLAADRLFLSLERNMNCAIGLCGHCQFGPQFICKDGPVFAFPQVADILKIDDL